MNHHEYKFDLFHLSCRVRDSVGQVLEQAANISIFDKSSDALSDVIHKTQGITQEVDRTKNLCCLWLELLK